MQLRPPSAVSDALFFDSPFNQPVGRNRTLCWMEGLPISQTTRPHLLQSVYRRQKETNVHILRPAQHINGYEHVLDLGPFPKGSSFDISCFQNGLGSPAELQSHPRKNDKNLGILLGDHGPRASHRTPALDVLSPGPSGDHHGPPPWSRTRFKLNRPLPVCASPIPPLFPHPGRNNARSDFPHPLDLKDALRHDNGRHPSNSNQRKSCEYCRFRKKKCSGHNICSRCSRIGIDCVYMPDLIAKRMADGLPEIPSPIPGSRFPLPSSPSSGASSCTKFDIGQLSHRNSAHSCVASSSMDDDPIEIPARATGRGTKRRSGKGIANRIPRAARRPGRLQAGKDPTQSMTLNVDQSIPRGNSLNPAADDLESVCMELTHRSTGRVLGMAAENIDFRNAEPRCVSFDAFDRNIYVMSLPKRWDASEPQGVFDDSTATQSRYTENISHIPTSVATFGRFRQPEASSLDMGFTSADAVPTSGPDVFPLLETRQSLEPFTDLPIPSFSSPSAALPSSTPVMLPDSASGHSPTESWTADDWLAWYDITFFL